MAYQARGAIRVKFTWEDETGSTGYSQGFLPAATLLADVKTKADALAADAAAASDCKLMGYGVNARFANDAPGTAGAGSRVERRAEFVMQTQAFFPTTVSIPGPKAEIVKQSGGIDDQNALVSAFTGELVAGGWCDSRGSDITGLLADYERSNSTSKRQKTTDIVVDAA